LKTFTHRDKSEVDLRVAQVLKNNQDYIYQTFQEIQALKEGIQSLSLKHDLVVAQSGSDAKALLIEFENHRETLVFKINELNQRVGDIESKISYVLAEFKELGTEVHLKYLPVEEFVKTVTQQDEAVDQVACKVMEKTNYFNIALDAIKSQFKDQLESVKKDLTPVVPEVDPIQQKIDENLKVFKVDFDGLVREIEFLKKENAYDQKKFENIYTLIERLKARVA
jgi:SMC interacting uncharacterized protein involved in chromosome segregation